MYLPDIDQALQQLQQTLSNIYDIGEAKAISNIVLEHLLQMNRLSLQINKHHSLSANQFLQLQEITKRLLQNEPVQYVLGETEFYGLILKVNSSVLIPRQETEELVEWITLSIPHYIYMLPWTSNNFNILDIGVGSGCISLALKKEYPNANITGIDVSEDALSVAQQNSDLLQLPIDLQKIDVLDRTLWDLLPNYHIIVSNPPYICESEKEILDENVVRYEPELALFVADTDPLIFYKTIADLALLKLHKNSILFFEVSEHFAEDCKEMLLKKGFQARLRKDINGKSRMIQASIDKNLHKTSNLSEYE
ncbi:MAG: peptide chain release factor N(5)-glutamine methyltransferase [Chitinophagales bacterium]